LPVLTPDQVAAQRRRDAEKQRQSDEYVACKAAKRAVAAGEYDDVDAARASILASMHARTA
jgi:hypothetical protein